MRFLPDAPPVYRIVFAGTLALLGVGAIFGVIHSAKRGQIPPGIVFNRLENADRLLAAGSFEEAAAEYRTGVSVSPTDFEAWSKLGRCMQRMGRSEESLTAYREAWNLMPGLATTNNNLGTALGRVGETREAEKFYRRAITLDPGRQDARINLGALMLGRGRREEARALFLEALAADPGYAPAHGAMGALEAGAGNFEAAELRFAEALRLAPGNTGYARDLARVRADLEASRRTGTQGPKSPKEAGVAVREAPAGALTRSDPPGYSAP